MQQPNPSSNPYCAFKNDVERRRALNVRAICLAVVGVTTALASVVASPHFVEALEWLKALAN